MSMWGRSGWGFGVTTENWRVSSDHSSMVIVPSSSLARDVIGCCFVGGPTRVMGTRSEAFGAAGYTTTTWKKVVIVIVVELLNMLAAGGIAYGPMLPDASDIQRPYKVDIISCIDRWRRLRLRPIFVWGIRNHALNFFVPTSYVTVTGRSAIAVQAAGTLSLARIATRHEKVHSPFEVFVLAGYLASLTSTPCLCAGYNEDAPPSHTDNPPTFPFLQTIGRSGSTLTATTGSVGPWVADDARNSKMIDLVVARRRSIQDSSGEPGGECVLLIRLSQDRWIRLRGAEADLRTVVARQGLRPRSAMEGFTIRFRKVSVYLAVALSPNISPVGRLVFCSSILMAPRNSLMSCLLTLGRVVRVEDPTKCEERMR
ncbi:hypothetical protein EDD85DRAFT_794268 [Armillaria nabsnona]|nr:hypothetical protein EDD85DRAFT_794268 [Armillaria nabsnona]